METWKKFTIFLIIVIPITISLTLLAINFNGWGTTVSQSTAGFTSGLQKIGAYIPTLMLQNGYIMLLCYISVPLLMFGFALLYWNKDWGYKLQGAASTTENKLTDYATQREPDEPETHANTTTTT